MAFSTALRPPADADLRAPSPQRSLGIALALVGLAAVTVTLVANLVAGDQVAPAAVLAWSFGLTTTGFGIIKAAIAVILIGIVIRLWVRVDSVKAALPALTPAGDAPEPVEEGSISTPHGRATVTAAPPRPLFIHRAARATWAPMLAMGAMAVAAGLVLSLVQAGNTATDPGLATTLSAWVQGLQFLGEALLLSGISFLLGTILGSLRAGGGEVQAASGVRVETLALPTTAKAFVLLMVAGLMVSIAQFVVYLWVSTQGSAVTVASTFAWLGPFREFGLGLLLAAIVLALATIGRALAFQFGRIEDIIRTGR